MKPTWQSECGSVQLYLGDCMDVLRELPDGSVDCVWTDPPYGHSNQNGDLQSARVRDGVKGGRVKECEPIENDSATDMRRVVDDCLNEVARVLAPDCCCCCCGGGPKPTFAWTAERMDAKGLSFFHALVWDKSARGNGMGWRYRRNYEFVMVSHRQGGRLKWSDNSQAVPNILRHSPPRDRIHPNEKPLDLIEDMVS